MKELPKISEAEWEVMKTIWEHSPCTSNQIIECLEDTSKWMPKTIKTLINRLVNGSTYMFLQWKSGDYVFRDMVPSYYVLKNPYKL